MFEGFVDTLLGRGSGLAVSTSEFYYNKKRMIELKSLRYIIRKKLVRSKMANFSICFVVNQDRML